jgi:galactokinase
MISLDKLKFAMLTSINDKFLKHFGESENEIFTFFAPGRVNLIGEHIDYNGGLVLPFAIDLGTKLAIRNNGLNVWQFFSENQEAEMELKVSYPILNQGNSWVNYPMGVMELFANKYKFELKGMDFYYEGNLPQSSGLSSSASIEAVTAIALAFLSEMDIDKTELAVLCQHAENEFAGVQCGIMDQFVSINAQANHALLLNCTSLKFEQIPLHIAGYEWVIANTNKPRELVESAYNQRLKECKLALNEINRHSIDNRVYDQLCHISPILFKDLEQLINSEVLVKRARHAIYEQQRVIEMVDALEMGNILKIGRLLNESHHSLKNDFEVSGFELDTLVEKSQELSYVLGSRMTGAGFGGCTVSLVKSEHVFDFENEVTNYYVAQTGLVPSFYIVKPSQGAHQIL